MNTLYITYDGLLDPLGKSQVLPYIHGVRDLSDTFHIISFEKASKSETDLEEMQDLLSKKNISWTHLRFSSSQSLFAKLSDILSLYFSIFRIIFSKKIDLIHARGLPSASTGLFFKRIFKIKLIFDFRGLWADERVTKGGWDLSKLIHKLQYRFFKYRETSLFREADVVIVLTEKVLDDILLKNEIDKSKFTVIPCAADFELFNINISNNTLKQSLEIDKNHFVIGYLGSIGPMYQFKAYLKLLSKLNEKGVSTIGLIATNDTILAKKAINDFEENILQNKVIIRNALRAEVPKYLNIMDALVAFYSIKYSVISVSPTKIGEALACGVPIICNAGIGDTDFIIKKLDAGYIFNDLTDNSIDSFVRLKYFPFKKDKQALRDSSKDIFDLKIAIKRYRSAYQSAFKQNDKII